MQRGKNQQQNLSRSDYVGRLIINASGDTCGMDEDYIPRMRRIKIDATARYFFLVGGFE